MQLRLLDKLFRRAPITYRIRALTTTRPFVERFMPLQNIPTEMKALVLDAYNDDVDAAIRSLRIATRPIPPLKQSEVLVKMDAAPCNPSDLLFIQKRYGIVKELPTVPGWEGAGTVVAAGGIKGRWLLGRRVAVGGQGDRDGTWAEYYVTEALGGCIPLKKGVSLVQGASLLVNPLTAVGLLETAKSHGAAATLQTAAASQAGRMIIRLAQEMGMPLVNIVRRQEQVDLLAELGAENLLNSSEPDFEVRLVETCQRLNVTVAFDAVAGDMTGCLFNAMQPGATVYVYGALDPEPCSDISPLGLIFRQKTVKGFFLTDWIGSQGLLKVMRASNRVQNLIASGAIETKVRQHASLEEATDALLSYVENMTEGKVLIRPEM
jgi:NADPH2:quinone reductase